MKKIKFIFIKFILFLGISQVYADVPYEVWKKKIVGEASIYPENGGGFEVIVKNGKIMSTSTGYKPQKGKMDTRVKTLLSRIDYKMEFRNVGKMGNKGWTSFGGYEKARLTITPVPLKSYYWYDTGKTNPMFGANYWDKKEVDTPFVDSFVFDMTFSGGPYGEFYYKDKKGVIYRAGHIVDGRYIQLEFFDFRAPAIYTDRVKIFLDNSAYGKWMEILTNNDGECQDTGDSGIRFSDYNGEVSVRPDNDEDAWFGAELDMVLCVDYHIKTGDDSTCVLSLADMTTFIMKPESEIILSTPPKRESKLKLIAGKIYVNVKQMLKDGTMDVEMSEAVAGIKGTIFELEDNGQQSKLKVFRGIVEFTSKRTGKKVLVKAGEKITATKSGLGKKEKFNIKKDEKQWKDIKVKPLKPLLSKEKIKEIHKRDKNRGEIKEAPSSSGEKINKNQEQKSDNLRNYILFLLVFLIIIGIFVNKKINKK